MSQSEIGTAQPQHVTILFKISSIKGWGDDNSCIGRKDQILKELQMETMNRAQCMDESAVLGIFQKWNSRTARCEDKRNAGSYTLDDSKLCANGGEYKSYSKQLELNHPRKSLEILAGKKFMFNLRNWWGCRE